MRSAVTPAPTESLHDDAPRPLWARLLDAVPDAATAALLVVCLTTPAWLPPSWIEYGMLSVMLEAGFLMFQCSLVDVATRLQKPPPIWLAIVIVSGLLLFSQGSAGTLMAAWEMGPLVLLPVLASLWQRAALLWRMPGKPALARIRVRALTSNRLAVGLCALPIMLGVLLVNATWPDFGARWIGDVEDTGMLGAGSLYFLVGAIDILRVHAAGFARKPRTLLRWDPLDIHYLQAL